MKRKFKLFYKTIFISILLYIIASLYLFSIYVIFVSILELNWCKNLSYLLNKVNKIV